MSFTVGIPAADVPGSGEPSKVPEAVNSDGYAADVEGESDWVLLDLTAGP